jgi:hypothetical protein
MVGEPSWEQKRPVSAPAVRLVGRQLTGGLGATSPISRQTAKWVRVERESERPILPMKWGNARGGKQLSWMSRGEVVTNFRLRRRLGLVVSTWSDA